jgi:hypothetical protein
MDKEGRGLKKNKLLIITHDIAGDKANYHLKGEK